MSTGREPLTYSLQYPPWRRMSGKCESGAETTEWKICRNSGFVSVVPDFEEAIAHEYLPPDRSREDSVFSRLRYVSYRGQTLAHQ